MQTWTPHRPGDPGTATRIFGTVTVTVGSLYLTTHSVAVTAIGASAATAISTWTAWLGRTSASGHPGSGGAADEVPRAGRRAVVRQARDDLPSQRDRIAGGGAGVRVIIRHLRGLGPRSPWIGCLLVVPIRRSGLRVGAGGLRSGASRRRRGRLRSGTGRRGRVPGSHRRLGTM